MTNKQKAKDPLIDSEASERAHYATGVLLDAGDFIGEQTYHRGRLARALSYLHGVGTVAGLEAVYCPKEPPERPEDEIEVHPGLALDALGRMIEIPRKACIRVARWYEGLDVDAIRPFTRGAGTYTTTKQPQGLPNRAVVADLFLRFLACERGKTPSFATGPYDATNAVAPARWRDAYELRLSARAAADEEDAPPEVPGSNLPELSSGAVDERRKALRQAIFAAWEGPRSVVLDGLRAHEFLPAELRSDPTQLDQAERDPAWIFLARVVIGIDEDVTKTETGSDGAKRPLRTGEVVIDNDERPFSITSAALARWAGI